MTRNADRGSCADENVLDTRSNDGTIVPARLEGPSTMPVPTPFMFRANEPLPDAFAQLPNGVKPYLRDGFSVLAGVEPDKFQDIVEIAAESIRGSSYAVSSETVQSRVGLNADVVGSAIAALSITMMALAMSERTSDEFMSAAQDSGLLTAADAVRLKPLAEYVVAQREPVTEAIEKADVVQEILPSLVRFDAVVDLRLGKTGKKERRRSVAVPVVIAYIATDADKLLWFQMSKTQTERLIEDLQQILKRVVSAEAVAASINQEP